jgi:Flp pilus assembly protein TadG
MRTKIGWFTFLDFSRFTQSVVRQINRKGQALVEFTLVFLLFLVVAWIPADFGLAFYTGQIAQNAVREGARIAAADPTFAGGSSCGPPLSSCFGAGNILNETAVRLPSALLGPSTTITVVYPTAASAGTCNQQVQVTVTGQYPFFFYKIFKLMRINVTIPQMTRSAAMRWEHQTPCPSF